MPKDFGMKLALFADAGLLWDYQGPTYWNVTGESLLLNESQIVRSSIGAGLIWDSPFGPLRFDLAYALTKGPYDKTQLFRFGGGTRFSPTQTLSSMIRDPKIRRPRTVRAAITGVHGALPDHVLTNTELVAMVDTTDAWITERTGVKERRILKDAGIGHVAHGKRSCQRTTRKNTNHTKRDRSADLRDHDARYGVSVDGKSHLRNGRHSQHRQLRRAGGMLGLHLRADDRFPVRGNRTCA